MFLWNELFFYLIYAFVANPLTPEQVQAYRTADNKTGEIAEWDYNPLPMELKDLQNADFDLSVLGFDSDELDKLLNGDPPCCRFRWSCRCSLRRRHCMADQ